MYHGSFVLLFFFSSRRRHTRLQGDWSSDVCSSDLRGQPEGVSPRRSRDEEGASTLVVDDRLGPWVVERGVADLDRKSIRLNSSHLVSSYAVFCLKKKTLTLI